MALNYYSVINNSAWPAAIKLRVLNAVVYTNGYTDTVPDANGNQVANPVTKTQYFNNVVQQRLLKAALITYEAETAGQAAKNTKVQEIESMAMD